jgi:hypothetical protein
MYFMVFPGVIPTGEDHARSIRNKFVSRVAYELPVTCFITVTD